MASLINAGEIRLKLGRKEWSTPQNWMGDPNSWIIDSKIKGQIIISVADYEGILWIHASISRVDEMPTYEDLKLLHQACFNNGFAYQVFVPNEKHVNFHEYALHLWGRLDGKPAMTDFGALHEQWFGIKMV